MMQLIWYCEIIRLHVHLIQLNNHQCPLRWMYLVMFNDYICLIFIDCTYFSICIIIIIIIIIIFIIIISMQFINLRENEVFTIICTNMFTVNFRDF